MHLLKTKQRGFSAEIGKPVGLNLELMKTFDIITVSIGCYIKNEVNEEKRVYIYEDYTDTDNVSVDSIIETDAPPTYQGELVDINWFMTIEAGGETQTFDFTVYPYHYNKYHQREK